MDPIGFYIFEPSHQQIRISRNKKVLFLICVSFIIAIIPIKINGMLMGLYFSFAFLYSFFCFIVSFFTYKPLYGKIDGVLEFHSEAVLYGDYRIDLSEVKSMDFHFMEYKGQIRPYRPLYFNQYKSRGVKNSFEYTDLQGETFEIFFQLEHLEDHKNLEHVIDHYFRIGKISHERRYELQNCKFYW